MIDLKGEWIDLSHRLTNSLPRTEIDVWHSPEIGWQTNAQNIRVTTHSGTHVDAPAHFGFATTMDQIPLDTFAGRGVTVQVERKGGEEIPVADLEACPMEIRAGDLVFISSGWDTKLGTNDFHTHPYLSTEAAEWLVARGVKLVGVDFISPDKPTPLLPPEPTKANSGFDYPVHRTLLGNGVLIAENVANLRATIGREFLAFAFPTVVGTGDGGLARIVALISD